MRFTASQRISPTLINESITVFFGGTEEVLEVQGEGAKPKYDDVIVSYSVRHDSRDSKRFWKCGPFFLSSPKHTSFAVYT